jgi:hypothetical protein
MVQNSEINLTALILIIFIFTHLMSNNVLFLIDNPIVRILLILLPFAAMRISHRLALLVILTVGTLFFERNRRKLAKVDSTSWWNSVNGEAIPGPLPKNIPAETVHSQKSTHQTPFMPDGMDNDGCEKEDNPIIKSDLNERIIFETIYGDSSIGNKINKIINQSNAPMPMKAWLNANDVSNDNMELFN